MFWKKQASIKVYVCNFSWLVSKTPKLGRFYAVQVIQSIFQSQKDLKKRWTVFLSTVHIPITKTRPKNQVEIGGFFGIPPWRVFSRPQKADIWIRSSLSWTYKIWKPLEKRPHRSREIPVYHIGVKHFKIKSAPSNRWGSWKNWWLTNVAQGHTKVFMVPKPFVIPRDYAILKFRLQNGPQRKKIV